MAATPSIAPCLFYRVFFFFFFNYRQTTRELDATRTHCLENGYLSTWKDNATVDRTGVIELREKEKKK